jgi:hypothetical protein
MRKPHYDIVLSTTDVERIMTSLQSVRQALPFLEGLTPLEKQRLMPLGIKAQTFVGQAMDAAERHSNIVPQFLDVDAARRSLALFMALNPILQELNELQELVECTQMLAGSEAYAAARLVYRSLKAVGKGGGLNSVVTELAQQFRSSRRRSQAADTSADPAPDSQ